MKIKTIILKSIIIYMLFNYFNFVYAKDPLSAIEWLNNSTIIENQEKSQKQIKNLNLENIVKSNIKNNNINGTGVIPENLSLISKNSWNNVDEIIISNLITKIKDNDLIRSRRLYKQLLIAETNPPLSNIQSKNMGKNFLIARLNKLLDIGAFDEAKEILSRINNFDASTMEVLIRLSYLTGDIQKVCNILEKKPFIISNLEPKILCFYHKNDWNAAILVLSTAATLNKISADKEILLVNFLQNKTQDNKKYVLDDLSIYLMKKNLLIYNFYDLPLSYKRIYYNLLDKEQKKTEFAEFLLKKDMINHDILFKKYRKSNNKISTLIKNFDLSIEQNNIEDIEKTLKKLVLYFHQKNILIHFSEEYFEKLKEFSPSNTNIEFNELICLIFALYGEIPEMWKKYKPKNHEVSFAFSLIKGDFKNKPFINTSIQKSIFSSFSQNIKYDNENNFTNLQLKSTGLSMLASLKMLDNGHDATNEEIKHALFLLNKINHKKNSKNIAIELLVHSSIKKW